MPPKKGATPALQDEWRGDSAKWCQDKKLDSLDSRMRAKTSRVLDALTAQGFRPKIYYAWRSVAVQHRLFEEGNSKVRFSFHNAQMKNGTLAGLHAYSLIVAMNSREFSFWNNNRIEAAACYMIPINGTELSNFH
ncbi:MAG: hypothetical protein JRF48_05025 [Deltaproteobacteria bacterium]|nr:hypothetical protein [Deltaproteobacteria bacterium]MBW2213796.1 hypothetical protein [Deltaproteobacteria bacterium]